MATFLVRALRLRAPTSQPDRMAAADPAAYAQGELAAFARYACIALPVRDCHSRDQGIGSVLPAMRALRCQFLW